MQYCNFLVRVDFLPILISESPDDGCYSVPAQMWLYSLPSLPSLLDHGWPHDQPKWLGSHQRLRSLAFSSSSSPSSSSYSHSSGSASVSNVGIHCSKTEELTCCPFMLKLWLLIVKLCDGCLPLWWVSVHIWMAVCSLWNKIFSAWKLCQKQRIVCSVWKKCVLELQFECKAGTVLVV